MKKFALFLLCFWLLPAVAEVAVIKSPADAKSYRALVLKNGLKVLLVSDPGADKAAAALDVHVGSGSEPDERPGLAHFLEHMLFLGTENYPEAGEYQAFIQAHGGSNNAYTSFDHTNYHFDISPEYLEPALDRFAQFFIAPLFTAEFVQRERNIVHSEYQSRLKEDGRRLWAGSRRAMNPEHPMSRFSVGSVETLADRPDDQVRDDLVAFYRRHYSAGIMALAVIGREPLDVLEKWVREKFSAIPRTGAEAQRVTQPLYGDQRLPARLDLVPEKEQQQVSFTFPIPSSFGYYREKPAGYIANLVGHEGEGSLFSLLKEKGWAESLSAGVGFMDETQGTFVVTVALTSEGLKHVDEIAGLLFQTIRLIRDRDIEAWRYEEERRLAELAFRFREETDEAAYARSLASRLQRFPFEDVLRGPWIMESWDPDLIRRFLDHLRPDNLLMTVVAKGLETDGVEPWYGVPYRLRPLEEPLLESWRATEISPELRLPGPNPFIPEDLSMAPAAGDRIPPVETGEFEGLRLWHAQDTSFGTPRAGFYFSVQSPLASRSARDAVLTELYVKAVQDQLNEFSYPAYLAGLEYELYRHARGVSVRIRGYADKQRVLLERIVQALLEPALEAEKFGRFREELARELRNVEKEPPANQVMTELYRLLMRPYWSEKERLAALEGVDAKALREFVPAFLEKVSLVALSHGNVTRDRALQMAEVLHKGFGKRLADMVVRRPRIRKLEQGAEYARRLELDHSDSAIALYLQGGSKAMEERAQALLLGQLLETPFYYRLRTVEQAGYIVFASAMEMLEVPATVFVIQSPAFRPSALYARIDGFLEGFDETLSGMNAGDFETVRAGLLSTLLQKDRKLSERTARYWREIDRRNYRFDSRERLAAAVRGLTRTGMAEYYARVTDRQRGRRLVVSTTGSGGEGGAELPGAGERKPIEDPAAFRDGDGDYFPEY